MERDVHVYINLFKKNIYHIFLKFMNKEIIILLKNEKVIFIVDQTPHILT